MAEPVYLDPAYEDFKLGVTPLELRKLHAFHYTGIVLPIFFIVLSLFFLTFPLRNELEKLSLDQILDQKGISHTGTVQECSNGRGAAILLTATYQVNGRNYRLTQQVNGGSCSNFSAGRVVDIQYDAQTPDIARFAQQPRFSTPGFLFWGILFVVVLIGPARDTMTYFLMPGRRRYFEQKGQVLDGVLVYSGKIKHKYNFLNPWSLKTQYQFIDPEGIQRMGWTHAYDDELVSRGERLLTPETPVKILYADAKTHMIL
jgi:hypothetical protein